MLTDKSNYLASGETETFHILLNLFKQLKTIYNSKSPIINVHDVAPGLWFPNAPPPMLLRGHEAFIITVIRKTNLLTFILTTLYCFNYGFDLLQSTFLDIFCPNTLFTGTTNTDQNGKFLKSQAILYLDLKTQALISGLKEVEDDTGSIPREKLLTLLDEVFPEDLSEQLIKRRCGGNSTAKNTSMTPSEQDFIDRCNRRRENLLQFDTLNDLVASYDWNHFIKELLDYCNKNMGLIIWGRKGRGKSPLYTFDATEFDSQIMYASGVIAANYTPINESDLVHMDSQARSATGVGAVAGGNNNNNNNTATDGETTTLLNNSNGTDLNKSNPLSNERGSRLESPMDGIVPPPSMGGAITTNDSSVTLDTQPSSNTSKMTQYIVNAAVAASGSRIKKLKSKRTWSTEEEVALTEGLKQVGPAWSKILDMYGPGGKISESLKNRTQVQLKDKARNWKLHYLKTGKTLPLYLSKVTGTLDKSRARKKTAKKDNNNNSNSTINTDNDTDTATAAVNNALSVDGTPSVTQQDNTDAEVVAATAEEDEEDDDVDVDSSRQNTQEPTRDLFENDGDETTGFDPALETTI